ncbi:TonB-dependent receptor [bacterium]
MILPLALSLFLNVCQVPTLPDTTQYEEVKADTIKVRYRFNPILVTATKVAGAQRDLVASVSVIEKEALNQAPTSSVFEVVKNSIPGLYVTEWGVMGFGAAGNSAGKVSIRGMGGGANTHVLVLRNGRPDFMGLMGCTVADEFTIDGVERIEILRGPASFLYGTNATGGVINIVSQKMKKNGFKTIFSGGYGTFNTQKLHGTHMGKIGGVEYVFTASTRRTAGHRREANSSYKADTFTAHIGYKAGRNTTVDLNANLANIDVNDPGKESEPFTDHRYDLKRYGGDITLEHKSRWGDTCLKLHGNFGKHAFFDGWHSTDRTLGMMAYQNFKPWTGNTTTVGFDYKRYGGRAENVETEMDYGSFFITENGPYIHMQQLVGRFIASVGMRVEYHQLFGDELVPKFGMVTHLTDATSIRLSAAKGFRSPSIRELYFFPPQNAELKPDRMWNYEIGFTQFIQNRLKLEGSLFRSEGSNLIRPSNPGYPFQWVNSGAFVHTGYELMASWLPFNHLELSTSWSKLDLGNETLYAPSKKLTARVVWRISDIRIAGDFVLIQDLFGADNRRNPLEDYALLNMTAQIPLLRTITLKGALKNVFNNKYQTMLGYPMPGRHILIDVRYCF